MRGPKRAWLRKALHREANGLRGLYGVPIYLTGSALFDFNANPRDWDIRCTLPDEQFLRRFGDPARWRKEGSNGLWTAVRVRWSDECVKRSQRLSAALDLNVDFQIYAAEYVERMRYNHRPRLQLDRFRRQA